MARFPKFTQYSMAVLAAMLYLFSPSAQAQSFLFDGNFESGTFQGWTPSGQNEGFASVAAKGTCFSANDTTAISFNGDLGNQYAALLRSNSAGDPTSIARLRSLNFVAGRGILFSALSETNDGVNSNPVNLVVRILDSEGQVLSELPLQTAVINLSPGCPSVKRDAAFSVHYIDTTPYNGEISIEFMQHTNVSGSGYFTLIDNVVFVERDQVFVNQTQPVAVAGTSLTSSNILFLDPRASFDPDNLPSPLEFSWFINGEETIRLFDLPCVNVNSDFELGPGNHTATLFVTDGINYAADTLNFVVTSGLDGATNDSGITLTTPEGDPIINEVNLVNEDGVTLTDPQNECNIDVAEVLVDSGPNVGELSIDVDSTSDEIFNRDFTIGGSAVSITSSNVDIQAADDATVNSVTVSITNSESTDTLTVVSNPVTTLTISGDGTDSIAITPDGFDTEIAEADFEAVLEVIQFEYTVPDGETAVTDQRTITYTASDSEGNSATTSSTVTIIDPGG